MAGLTKTQKDPHTALIDGCGRRIDHLRLSVTSKCDLRCVYCEPESATSADGNGQRTNGNHKLRLAGAKHDAPKPFTLTDEQRVEFVAFLHERYGLSQVRITGGEPLIYRGTVSLVASIRRRMPGIRIAMTTNGRLLYQNGLELKRAGLDRLNVSLDSLDPARYHAITRGHIDAVLDGLRSAIFVGFDPPKINTVVLKGMNDGELVGLAQWAMARGHEIRFLEAMPIGPVAELNRRAFVPASQIRALLAEEFTLEPLEAVPGETAKRYAAVNGSCRGVIGIIAPVSEPFCAGCRRIRLTADGRLFPCLLDNRSVDLASAWHDGVLRTDAAAELITSAIAGKKPVGKVQSVPMISLGG